MYCICLLLSINTDIFTMQYLNFYLIKTFIIELNKFTLQRKKNFKSISRQIFKFSFINELYLLSQNV